MAAITIGERKENGIEAIPKIVVKYGQKLIVVPFNDKRIGKEFEYVS